MRCSSVFQISPGMCAALRGLKKERCGRWWLKEMVVFFLEKVNLHDGCLLSSSTGLFKWLVQLMFTLSSIVLSVRSKGRNEV